MFKIQQIENIRHKIKQAKIAGISFAIIFVAMILNLIYLNWKVINLSSQLSSVS